MSLINKIKTKFPSLTALFRYIKYAAWINKTPEEIFTEIYTKRKWGDADSLSGPGSYLQQTVEIRKALPRIIVDYQCRSLLDIPCGDFNWMSQVNLNIDYLGADIVHDIITHNQQQYQNSQRKFIRIDLIEDDLPQADLVLCRDCLVHFSYDNIGKAIQNIRKSGSQYLLTTTFKNTVHNKNIPTGAWRPINLLLPPFNFPEPLLSLDEKCTLEHYSDKQLGLWKIADIPVMP